jgi:hypothetical protein
MPDHDDAAVDDRWRDLADAEAVGDALEDDELEFLRAHADDTPERRAERELLDSLAALDEPVPLTREDEAIADAVIAQFRDEATPARSVGGDVVAFPRRAVVGAGMVATGLAAAAAVALWMRPAPEAAPVVADAEEAVETVAAPSGPILRSGALAFEGTTLAAGDEVPTDVWLTGSRDGSCIESSICADEGARIKLGENEAGRTLEVEAGRVRVDGHFGPLQVTTFQGRVASDGGRFTVEVTQEQVVVVVLVGPVTVISDDGEQELESGSRLALGEVLAVEDTPEPVDAEPEVTPADGDERAPASATKPAKASSAADMLAQAQSLRGAGQHRRAAAAYERLLAEYPASAEAHAAAVTLGKLQLGLGKARKALDAYDRYLKKGGALAEEAAYGRIRALDQLGRTAQRDTAIDRFAADYPRSVYASKVEALRK